MEKVKLFLLLALFVTAVVSEEADEEADEASDEGLVSAVGNEQDFNLEIRPYQCCKPDFLFMFQHSCFSQTSFEKYAKTFMIEIVASADFLPCNDVRAAELEYGDYPNVRFRLNDYRPTSKLIKFLADFHMGPHLGKQNNMWLAIDAAINDVFTVNNGYKAEGPNYAILVSDSNPTNYQLAYQKINMLKQLATVIVIGVGQNYDVTQLESFATNSSYFFKLASAQDLMAVCSLLKKDFCPVKPTVPPITTRTTQPEPTTPTKPPTTVKTTTKCKTRTTTIEPPTVPPETTKKTTQPEPTKPPTKPPQPTTTKRVKTRSTAKSTQPPTIIPPTPSKTTIRDYTNPPTVTPPNDFCFQCYMRRNPKDLYADPTECHHYYQCFYFNETYAVGIRRICPDGTFWHEAVLQCLPEGPIPCVDACLDDSVSAKGCYALPKQSCRKYFVCANTASYGMCCPIGTKFVEATCSCEPSVECADVCIQDAPRVPTTVKPSSQYNATVCLDSFGTYISIVQGERNAYFLIDADGQVTKKLYCPSGILFDLITCRCNEEGDVTIPPAILKRQALLWIPFDVDILDYSYNKFSTFDYGTCQRDTSIFAFGAGSMFVNNGRIEVPGLKTYDWRNAGSWCAFFRCEDTPGYRCLTAGGILSNNEDGTTTKYTIVLGTKATSLVSTLLNFWHPVNTQSVTATVSTTPANGWNHVCTTYDGNAIRLHLNGVVVDTQFVGGYLSIAHCPLVIGHDQQLGYFNGHIDDVLLTAFTMTTEEINAHLTGNRAYLVARGFFPAA